MSVPNPPAGSPLMTAHTSTDPSPSEQTGLSKPSVMVAISKTRSVSVLGAMVVEVHSLSSSIMVTVVTDERVSMEA